ncbi:MAG: PAS domain S-box protein [Promethearchaeia archaeon]|nr:MAG: PAS domain S-box protein [Candidatus Lokiarchaeia archaeon]
MEENPRRNALKEIILQLHQGKTPEELQERFRKEFGSISSDEIAALEQDLINSGDITTEQVTKLCDLHVQIFKESIDIPDHPELTPGHPIHTYRMENAKAREIIRQLKSQFDPDLYKSLEQIKIHYTRSENQLFPMLEKVGFAGPSQVMWAKHDEVREMFRNIEKIEKEEIYQAIEDMIYKEENILFPTALEKLNESQWIQVKNGEEQIGFAWITPGNQWKPITPETIHQHTTEIKLSNQASTSPSTSEAKNSQKQPVTSNLDVFLHLNTGSLNLTQLDLMLRHLPFDITFIDANDNVLYYSDTPDRLFPRSPGIIGRNVMNCHPPKSQHIVKRILNTFKAGTKDSADFWIRMGDKFIFIRYFAVRDDNGNYQGTLEVSQEISQIKEIEGERRLLNWEQEQKS